MLFLVITSNKGKHKVITLYNLWDIVPSRQVESTCCWDRKNMIQEWASSIAKRFSWTCEDRNEWTDVNECRSSKKERRVDALALRADERRDKLRKAAGRSKYPSIRRCLNGETRPEELRSPYGESIAIRREPGELKHLSSRRKRKQRELVSRVIS